MLIVTVEIAPCGDLNNRKILGSMTIVNDTSGTMDIGSYDIVMCNMATEAYEQFRVTRFKRESGFWKLIHLSIGKWLKLHTE